MSIGDNIKEKRKALNLSQKDVARAEVSRKPQ